MDCLVSTIDLKFLGVSGIITLSKHFRNDDVMDFFFKTWIFLIAEIKNTNNGCDSRLYYMCAWLSYDINGEYVTS